MQTRMPLPEQMTQMHQDADAGCVDSAISIRSIAIMT